MTAPPAPPGGLRRCPRASRRRGLRKNSTGSAGLARRRPLAKPDTPREYPRRPPRRGTAREWALGALGRVAPSVLRGCRRCRSPAHSEPSELLKYQSGWWYARNDPRIPGSGHSGWPAPCVNRARSGRSTLRNRRTSCLVSTPTDIREESGIAGQAAWALRLRSRPPRPAPGERAPTLSPGKRRGSPAFGSRPAGPRRAASPRLTLARSGPYTLSDVDAPGAFVRTARSRAFRGRKHPTAGGGPRGPMERIARSLDEADLPAKEAPPRQGTRLPCPDEVDRRSTDPGRSPRSWPEAADGLIERGNHPPRLVMLSRPRDFATLQETGAVRSHPLLVVRFLRTDLETTRFGLATGRKLGGAVIRNRLRRRLREALRALAPSFQPGWDVLIIARPALVNATHEDLTEAVARLLRRGGVLEGPNSA